MRFVAVLEAGPDDLHVEWSPILPDVNRPRLELIAGPHPIEKLRELAMILRMDPGRWMQADEFRTCVAMHGAERRVRFHDKAVEVVDAQPIAGRLEDAAVLGFPFAERFLGMLACGDIPHHADEAHRLSLRPHNHRSAQLGWKTRPVLPQQGIFDIADTAVL